MIEVTPAANLASSGDNSRSDPRRAKQDLRANTETLKSLKSLKSNAPAEASDFKDFKDFNVSGVGVVAFLSRLETIGFSLFADGESLCWHGPAGVLTDDDRAAILMQKPALLAILQLREAANARTIRGVVAVDREIVRLWREAEAAVGESLTFEGQLRLPHVAASTSEPCPLKDNDIGADASYRNEAER